MMITLRHVGASTRTISITSQYCLSTLRVTSTRNYSMQAEPDGTLGKPQVEAKATTDLDTKIPELALTLRRARLDHYFATQHFDFGRKDYDTSKAKLERSVRSIYLRERPLVCIDIEAYEKNQRKVTEIGVAIYDPRAEQGGDCMFPNIRVVHILVEPHLHLVNSHFVPNHKEYHMGGTSFVMSFNDIRKFFDLVTAQYLTQGAILVGHHVNGDVRWLQGIGVWMPELEVVDTLKLHELTRLGGGLLRALLRSFDIPHGYLHNAANDAYYTMVAALALCDPVHRQKYALDTFEMVTSTRLAAEKKREKHLDRSVRVPGIVSEVFNSLHGRKKKSG